jgi:serine/threonine protein kinase
VAVAEAKARAGNPLLPMGVVREKVEGPLAAVQINRKPLVAIKAIGAGQFGKVYLATVDGDETQQRAIKMLRSGAASGDRQEFLREAETQLNLGKHPNLVEFIGVAVQQRPWLVILEFCQYGDLSDVLKELDKRRIPLTLQELLHSTNQLYGARF